MSFLDRLPSQVPAQEPAHLPSTAPSSSPDYRPTPQQLAFLSALTDTTRNITLQARAGSGKTSSILLGVDAYLTHFPSHELLICAYNKSIQLEIDAKLKSRAYDWRQVGCQTVHGMGMGLLKFVYRPRVEERKVYNLLRARQDVEPRTSPFWAYPQQVLSLVSLGKQAGVGFFDDLAIEEGQVWRDLADHYDVEFDGVDGMNMNAIIRCVQELYTLSLSITDEIDFDDMILLPLIKNLRVKFTKDLILGDEFQDWSRARQALVKKFARPHTGRIAAIGDDKQAIYGFSGADAQAMNNFTRELDAMVLPLSVTFRCPKAVVALAQGIVPDIEAAESAPDGEVLRQLELITRQEANRESAECPMCHGSGACTIHHKRADICLEDLTPGLDCILCRNNAPLIPLAYSLIRAGIPAKVEGRKIGEGLQSLCTRWQCRGTAELLNRLEDFRARETQKHLAKSQEAKAQEVEDRVDTLREIIAEVNRRGHRDIASVLKFIDDLFADGGKACVTLSSYHRSKGREWERVFLFEHASRCPSKAARQQWQKEQESNLAYVAYTRAKKTLVFIG